MLLVSMDAESAAQEQAACYGGTQKRGGARRADGILERRRFRAAKRILGGGTCALNTGKIPYVNTFEREMFPMSSL